MSDATVTALLSLAGTLLGSLGGVLASQRLTAWRLERLEEQVARHNRVVERTFRLEERVTALEKREGGGNHA